MLEITDVIEAKSRRAGSKGLARKLRHIEKRVPAVAYGPTTKPQHLSLDPEMLVKQRQHFGPSHIYSVVVAGGEGFACFIKDIQRHPTRLRVVHVDLYTVDMTRPIRVVVPIELTGKPAGLLEGGLLSQALYATEVMCLPNAVPKKLMADVTPLKVGDSLHLADMVLPDGLKLTSQGNEAVALMSTREAVTEAVPAAPGAASAPAATPAATPKK